MQRRLSAMSMYVQTREARWMEVVPVLKVATKAGTTWSYDDSVSRDAAVYLKRFASWTPNPRTPGNAGHDTYIV